MASLFHAKVKSVLSGDTVLLTALNNPKSERTLSLAFVSAPRIRREGDEVSMDHVFKKFAGVLEAQLLGIDFGLLQLPLQRMKNLCQIFCPNMASEMDRQWAKKFGMYGFPVP